MSQNRLTDTQIRSAKYDGKPRKIYDGAGLFLYVKASGRYWHFKYRHQGRAKEISFGVYPAVSLAKARERRGEARELVAAGVDPSEKRKAEKAAEKAQQETIKDVANQWLALQDWSSNYREKVAGRLRRHVFSQLGQRPVAEISGPELLEALTRIADQGHIETAHRVRRHLDRIYRYANTAGKASHNPAHGLSEALPKTPKTRHFGAITDPEKLGALLRAIDGYDGTPSVCVALRLAPILLARPGELRHMEWAEIDWANTLWSIPATKMKMAQPHLVPLPEQALAELAALHGWTGSGQYVFPSGRSSQRPMSENALGGALHRMGYSGEEATAHGFRATARTLLDEVLGFRPDVIEHQLAHAVRDANGRAYNRTTFLDERRKMLQEWANYLDTLRSGSTNVLSFPARDNDPPIPANVG